MRFPWQKVEKAPDFVRTIENDETWKSVAHKPAEAAYSNTSTVKVVFDIRPKHERLYGNKLLKDKDVGDDLATIYFLHSRRFPWHFRFVQANLMSKEDATARNAHHVFNDVQYNSEDRHYVLGSLVHYGDHGDVTCFELWPGDQLSGERVAALLPLLVKRVSGLQNLMYRPMSDQQEKLVAPLVSLPVITAKELFANVRYQALCTGSVVGRVRFVRSDRLETMTYPVKAFEILVMDSTANELPICAALITNVVQAPLCHTALLCQNRNAPNMALIGVCEEHHGGELSDKDKERIDLIKSLDGKWVRLSVRLQECVIVQMSKSDAVKEIAEKTHHRINHKLQMDISVQDVVSIPFFGDVSAEVKCGIGAKALQLGRLASVLKTLQDDNEVPADKLQPVVASVLPFAHFYAFMEEIDGFSLLQECVDALDEEEKNHLNASSELYASLVNDDAFDSVDEDNNNNNNNSDDENDALTLRTSRSVLAASINMNPDDNDSVYSTPLRAHAQTCAKRLTELILSGTNAQCVQNGCALITSVCDGWKSQNVDLSGGIIIRSSTNVEDLEGFNGAGLYDSIRVADHSSGDAVKDAIVRCYASMFSYRAFAERFSFGMDQNKAAMALLIQPYATHIHSNGVAISLIPFRRDFPGVYMNVQHKDAKVTDAAGQPEQLVVYDEAEGVVEIVGRSSLEHGKSVLLESEAQLVAIVVKKLKKAFLRRFRMGLPQEANAIDVEFLLVGEDRKLLIVQCRPCHYY